MYISVATPGSVTAEALATWPAWTAARARLEVLEAIDLGETDIRRLDPADDLADRTVALVVAGDLHKDELEEQVAAGIVQHQARIAIAAATTRALEAARSELKGLEQGKTGSGIILARLTSQLSSLLDDAAGLVDQLRGINDAEAALDAGQLEEWRQLQDLGRRYADVRAAQGLTFRRSDRWGQTLDQHVHAWMRRPELADPDLVARLAGVTIRVPRPEGGHDERDPRPAPAWPPLDGRGDGVAAVRWLAEHREVEPWCPDGDQLNAALNDLGARRAAAYVEANGGGPRRPASVRARDRER